MKLKKAILLIFIFNVIYMQAQEKTYSSGGNASGSGGSINYSIGQLVSNDSSDGTYTVSQGIQQAFGIFEILNLNTYQSTNTKIFVFPNPTANYLNLSINVGNSGKLAYQLFDSTGRLLQIKDNLKTNETISMEGLTSAVYYLNISENNQIKNTFKIIKN